MNTIQLSHSFQPLDNRTPDIIEIDGKCLNNSIPSEQEQRQIFVSKTSKVIQLGKKEQHSLSNIVIYHTKGEFVIETIPKEKDSLGRIAPIISYGKFPDEEQGETDWIDNVATSIANFAASIKVNLALDVPEKIKVSLTKILDKKKEKVENLNFLFRLTVAVTTPLLLAIVLLKIQQPIQQQIPQPILNWLLEIQLLQPIQTQVPPPSGMQIALFFCLNNALIIFLPKIKLSKLIR